MMGKSSQIHLQFRALRRTRWYDYAIRFLFGGLITVLTGVIGNMYGAAVAGLFLAFPAIFPATATLIEKKEKQRKHRAGMHGTARGRRVASVDAAGASMGSIGLLAFGAVTWRLLPDFASWLVLVAASAAWFALSFAVWWNRKLL